MPTQAQNVVNALMSYAGLREVGDNDVLFVDAIAWPYFGYPGEWCDFTVSAVGEMCGVLPLFGGAFGFTPSHYATLQKMGRQVPVADARLGDIVFFDWDFAAGNITQHVGFARGPFDRSGYLPTIEGNTSNGKVGSEFSGGLVYARQRRASEIRGVFRPAYAPGEFPAPFLYVGAGCTGERVKTIQAAVGADVDGIYGPGTRAKVRDFQDVLGVGLWPTSIKNAALRGKPKGYVDQATWNAISLPPKPPEPVPTPKPEPVPTPQKVDPLPIPKQTTGATPLTAIQKARKGWKYPGPAADVSLLEAFSREVVRRFKDKYGAYALEDNVRELMDYHLAKNGHVAAKTSAHQEFQHIWFVETKDDDGLALGVDWNATKNEGAFMREVAALAVQHGLRAHIEGSHLHVDTWSQRIRGWSLPATIGKPTNGLLQVDGDWGVATNKLLQRRLGVAVDGDPGIKTVTALQHRLNAALKISLKTDGLLGPQTLGALSRLLGTTVPMSDRWAVALLQQALNLDALI